MSLMRSLSIIPELACSRDKGENPSRTAKDYPHPPPPLRRHWRGHRRSRACPGRVAAGRFPFDRPVVPVEHGGPASGDSCCSRGGVPLDRRAAPGWRWAAAAPWGGPDLGSWIRHPASRARARLCHPWSWERGAWLAWLRWRPASSRAISWVWTARRRW